METRGRSIRADVAGWRGFTLVELLVSIGIIAVLVSLLTPTLAAARKAAEESRRMALLRQHVVNVHAYANDHADLPPTAGSSPVGFMLDWPIAAVAAGLYESKQAIDPDGMQRHDAQRFALSGALAAYSHAMEPGAVAPNDLAPVVAQRLSSVAFPSDKGAMAQWLHVEGTQHRLWTWNPTHRPRLPVVFFDGRAITARCVDFVTEFDFLEEWVGHPVLSTWRGVRGVDRVHVEL